MVLIVFLLMMVNLYSTISFYKKRQKLLHIASHTDEIEEKMALISSANNQTWRIVIFGMAFCLTLITMVMFLSSINN